MGQSYLLDSEGETRFRFRVLLYDGRHFSLKQSLATLNVCLKVPFENFTCGSTPEIILRFYTRLWKNFM